MPSHKTRSNPTIEDDGLHVPLGRCYNDGGDDLLSMIRNEMLHVVIQVREVILNDVWISNVCGFFIGSALTMVSTTAFPGDAQACLPGSM